MINDVLLELINLSKKNTKNCLSEDIVIDYADKNGLSIIEMSKLSDDLVAKGVRLVSSSEYEEAIKQTPASEPYIDEEIETLITLYKKLSNEQRIIFHERLDSLELEADKTSEEFIGKLEKAYLQYSYIAVLVKAFFKICDENGTVTLEKLTDKFKEHYLNRLQAGGIAEKADSKLSKYGFKQSDVRMLIILNPLKRSFLKKYFYIDRKSDIVSLDKNIWNDIDRVKKEHIISICESKLDTYYNAITQKVDPVAEIPNREDPFFYIRKGQSFLKLWDYINTRFEIKSIPQLRYRGSGYDQRNIQGNNDICFKYYKGEILLGNLYYKNGKNTQSLKFEVLESVLSSDIIKQIVDISVFDDYRENEVNLNKFIFTDFDTVSAEIEAVCDAIDSCIDRH